MGSRAFADVQPFGWDLAEFIVFVGQAVFVGFISLFIHTVVEAFRVAKDVFTSLAQAHRA